MTQNVALAGQGGIEFPVEMERIRNIVDSTISGLDDDDIVIRKLKQIYTFAQMLQSVAFDVLDTRRETCVADMKDSIIKTVKRLNEPPKPKKERFTTKDVMEIAQIKSETTVLKYFKDGTIIAQQDSKGKWYVLRGDLENYLGYTDF